MEKVYDIFLGEHRIGTTLFEKADAPMGVVVGRLRFLDDGSPYAFLKSYCEKRGIAFTHYPQDLVIAVYGMPGLRVLNARGVEITGVAGNSIEGMDSDVYEVTIAGVTRPSFDEEFPEHSRYH